MNEHDDQAMRDMEETVRAHKEKLDHTVEAFISDGMAKGEIREEHFERAPNGDSWFRLVDQEGVEIVYNYSKRSIHSYGRGVNSGASGPPRSVD